MNLKPDPVWTDRYERERDRIRTHSDPLDVFHVGSTAIPDLPGRPQLDVIAVYEDEAAMRAAADALVQSGDRWKRTDADGTIVVYWRESGEAVYLKLRVAGDEAVQYQLAFRDYLRENESARREYERVKRQAAAEYDDFQSYQEAKEDVVRRLTEEAREAGYFDALPDTVGG